MLDSDIVTPPFKIHYRIEKRLQQYEREKKNMKKKSVINHSLVIGNSKITLTKTGIKIQSPKVVIKGDLIKTGNISAKEQKG